jgi:hypothetical protein
MRPAPRSPPRHGSCVTQHHRWIVSPAQNPLASIEWLFATQLNTTNPADLAQTVLTPAPCASSSVVYLWRLSALTPIPGSDALTVVVGLLPHCTTRLPFGPARRKSGQVEHSSSMTISSSKHTTRCTCLARSTPDTRSRSQPMI